MKQIQKELIDGYQALYTNISNSKWKTWFRESAGHFTGMRGNEYESQEVKLLVVGRATNGWGQLDITNRDNFAKAAYKKISQEHIGKNMLQHMHTKFWKNVRSIWEYLSGNQIAQKDDMVANYIAWSNLYKIAPNIGKSKNPNKSQQLTQIEAAKKILQAEIAFFNPTHILFITEKFTNNIEQKKWWSWIEPFILGKDSAEQKKMNGFLNIKNIPGDVVRGKDIYTEQKIKVVVATRPDSLQSNRAYQKKWVQDIADAFHSL